MYCFHKIGVVDTPGADIASQKQENTFTGGSNETVSPSIIMLFLFGIFFPLASFAEGNRTVTILYTGSVKGTIDPCRFLR